MSSYADHFPLLRQGFERIQGADRAVRRLPDCDKRRRVLEHLEAAERVLNQLDTELQPDVVDAEEHESHDDRAMNPTCRYCCPVREAAQ
jgi:hypothetical protein